MPARVNMKDRPQETRSVTVIRHATDYLLGTATSMAAYADDVVGVYHERVPPRARVMHFHSGGDPAADLKANEQLVARVLNRVVRMPADLEEALVLALPEERRRACLRELAERYDLLAAPIPHESAEDDTASLASLLRETGEAIQALGPLLADGRIDASDRPHAKSALREINEAMAELVSWQARLTAILPDHTPEDPAVVPLRAR